MESFEVIEGSGSRGGMTIQIGEGPVVPSGQTRSIYLTDEAFCFVEPALKRFASNYGPYGRWGVTEVPSAAWRSTAQALKELASRIDQGQPFSSMDYIWVHTVDLDNEIEVDADTFGRELDNDPNRRAALRAMLTSVAEWIEDSIQRCDLMTVYGY